MKIVSVNFIQRIKLIGLLSVQEGTIGKTAVYLRLLDKVRFSDAEDGEITKIPVETKDGTMTHFQAPESKPDFAKKKLQIEDSDVAVLKGLIETWPHFTAQDHSWAMPLLDSLGKEKP